MGYVRMIRSGGLHFVSNSMKFVPRQQTEGTFRDLAKEELVSKETVEGLRAKRVFNLEVNEGFSTCHWNIFVMPKSENIQWKI